MEETDNKTEEAQTESQQSHIDESSNGRTSDFGSENVGSIPTSSTPESKIQEPKPMGRPSIFTQELADKICHELALGKSMRTVCAEEDMPAMSSVFKWLRENKDFSEQYARAKQESADAMAEEILDISDESHNDWKTLEYADGREYAVPNNEAIQRSRLRVDTRKWLMSKMKPKKYGDKLDLTSDGEVIKTNSIIFTDFNKNGTQTEGQ